MSAKRKRQEAFKAKEKKQKIIAGVGGVLLLGLLAFQVPRVMKMMHPAGAPAAAATTASTTTSTSPTPTPQASTTGDGSSAGGAGLAPVEEPERAGQCDGVKEVRADRDHHIHHASLDELLADL